MDILLVTAVLRMENLPYIARNIVKTFENEKELHLLKKNVKFG